MEQDENQNLQPTNDSQTVQDDNEQAKADVNSTDTNENESADGGSQTDTEKAKQSRAENAKFAEMRRRNQALEAENKRLREAQKAGISETALSELGLNKDDMDEDDKRLYNAYVDAVLSGKDNPKDYAYSTAYRQSKEAKREAQRLQAEKESKDKELTEKVRTDVQNFQKKFPSVDMQKVINDQEFNDYFKEKGIELTGNVTTYYSIYREVKGLDKGNSQEDKSRGALPSATGSNVSVGSKDIRKMTDEEFDAYWKTHYENR